MAIKHSQLEQGNTRLYCETSERETPRAVYGKCSFAVHFNVTEVSLTPCFLFDCLFVVFFNKFSCVNKHLIF